MSLAGAGKMASVVRSRSDMTLVRLPGFTITLLKMNSLLTGFLSFPLHGHANGYL